MIKIYESSDPDLAKLMKKQYPNMEQIEQQVARVLENVRLRGDEALVQYTSRFDGAKIDPAGIRVDEEEIQEAYRLVESEFIHALREAIDNIAAFHIKQKRNSWMEPDNMGNLLGQIYNPLQRVGIYVPGGTASYPSSVLMNAIPAKVAGVEQVVMVTPPGKDGSVNPYTLVAAAETDVNEIYKVGGVQAIGALAYGTTTIKKVDKITGPGNIYVTMAKKQVYGVVDIDMLAGPSEILVVADDSADPVFVAADLLSQAEHDTLASAVLITPSIKLAHHVRDELAKQLAELQRKEIATQSLDSYGAIIITPDLAGAIELANRFAPEHLELMVADPSSYLGRIKNAGAVFLGPYSPEPVGDYYAGPNHILPTGGTARFYSPVTVDTFIKKTSVISYSAHGLQKGASAIIKLAQVEGLDAHANAVKVRVDKLEGMGV